MKATWPPEYDRTYIPAPDSPFWNRRIETMDMEEREQTIILPKLQSQLKYAYEKSLFYKNKWDKAGVNPQDMRSLADFEAFPFVTKDEIRQDQIDYPPFGSNLCVGGVELARVFGTSGTAFGISKGDVARIAETHARAMWGFGVRQDDVVFIGSFFSLYWGSWGALFGTERLGATAFPFGAGVPGQSARAIEWMKEIWPKRPRPSGSIRPKILISESCSFRVNPEPAYHRLAGASKRPSVQSASIRARPAKWHHG